MEAIAVYESGGYIYGRMFAGPESPFGKGRFTINIGGADYYASEEYLTVEAATRLRDKLNAWLAQQ